MPNQVVKKRHWTFILYPESAPPDWIDILSQTGLLCAISPLHDRDIDEGVNQVKKAHYHIIVCYNGPTSFNVVKSLTEKLHCPIPKALESVRGMYRYFTHKDNPEKYQYDERDIVCVNGFSILDFSELTKSEVLTIKKKLQSLIREAGILEYSDLMDLLQDSDMDNEYDVASSNTYFFEKYISSRRNKRKA